MIEWIQCFLLVCVTISVIWVKLFEMHSGAQVDWYKLIKWREGVNLIELVNSIKLLKLIESIILITSIELFVLFESLSLIDVMTLSMVSEPMQLIKLTNIARLTQSNEHITFMNSLKWCSELDWFLLLIQPTKLIQLTQLVRTIQLTWLNEPIVATLSS